MKFVLSKLALFLCAVSPSVICGKAKLRLLKEEDEVHKEFPYLVSLEITVKPNMRICSGSLIAETWVLTAKHCFEIASIHRIRVRYADFTSPANETKAFSNVKRIYRYQTTVPFLFRVEIHWHDIGLAFIEKVPNGVIGKLSAMDYRALLGLPVKYAGFGYINWKTITNQPIISERLLLGEGVVVQCQKNKTEAYPYAALCMAPRCNKRRPEPRLGDSGGPLVRDGKIVGVTAEASPGAVGAARFTPISIFIDWIKEVTDKGIKL